MKDTSRCSSLDAIAGQKCLIVDAVEMKNTRDDQNGCSIQGEARAAEARTLDDDIPDYLLSILGLAGRPKFSEQEAALESATLTDKERAEALSDLFGQRCSVDARKSKGQRKDLDRNSIDFLVKQMQVEIKAIPVDKKSALIEAEVKARPEEFSDERLEKFLRCEGMNAKLATQ